MGAARSPSAPDEPNFPSAGAAIRFAMGTTGSAGRPLMNRMIDTVSGAREGTAAERAGDAGMILAHLKFSAEPLNDLELAVLTARCAPMAFPCHCRRACCSGRAQNREWRGAVDLIASASLAALPPGSHRDYALRSLILLKIFTGKGSFRQIGESLRRDEETVSRQHRLILRWLAGERGKAASRATPAGIEPSAWRKAEASLQRAGIVP